MFGGPCQSIRAGIRTRVYIAEVPVVYPASSVVARPVVQRIPTLCCCHRALCDVMPCCYQYAAACTGAAPDRTMQHSLLARTVRYLLHAEQESALR